MAVRARFGQSGTMAATTTRDFHATVLNLLGFDHQRFTIRHLGLDFRLTGVEHARVIPELMA